MNNVQKMRAFVAVVMVGLGLALPAAGSPYSDVVSADTPVSYWRLNETGGITAADSKDGNNGTYLNGVTLGQPGALRGDPDFAAKFDGVNDMVDVPSAASLNPGTYTIECWAKALGAHGGLHGSPLTSRSTTGTTKGYIFYALPGNAAWQMWTGDGAGGWATVPGPAVQVGQWAHLVGTFDGTTRKLYVNGTLAGSAAGGYVPNLDRPLRIGAGSTEGGGNFYFNGLVDETAVYNTALTADRVREHYRTALSPAQLFFADFGNPGGVGLGPEAQQMVFAGRSTASPTPTNPDGTLVLGGSGTGGIVFLNPLRPFTFEGPLVVSTQAYYVNGDAPSGELNAYFGLVALQRRGTASSGADRRGGLWAQLEPFTNGSVRMRVGFQSDSTAGGDLFNALFVQDTAGTFNPNGPFNMDLWVYGLSDADKLIFTASQGDFSAQIATTIGAYRTALAGQAGDPLSAFDLVLSELRQTPWQMNVGFLSTSVTVEGYNFLRVTGTVPEPGTLALLGAGLLALARRRRNR